MNALLKIRERITRLAEAHEQDGRDDDAFDLRVVARQLEEQAHMLEQGLSE